MIYANKIESYVKDFAESHQLFDPNQKYLLAISGGLDSIVLFHLVLKFKLFYFEVIHFNHGTRIQNSAEENTVKRLCLVHEIKFHGIHFTIPLATTNFEEKARTLRKNHYKKFIQDGLKVLEAHHLDDSFEWSLMQKFKQGSMDQTLGIPLISGNIIRPLLCLSKQQIFQYAQSCKLVWHEDQSNQNINYERNYVRLKIIPEIKKRFPQYLKHYVYQSNQLAFKLSLHRKNNLKKQSPLIIKKHFIKGVVLQSKNLELYREEFIKLIISMSDTNRGKINIILDQIFLTLSNIRKDNRYKKFHGPYSFSGNVIAFIFNDTVYLSKKDVMQSFSALDIEVVQLLKNKTQIPFGAINSHDLSFFPNIKINFEKNKNFKASKLTLPFFTQLIAYLKMSDIPYTFVSLLSE
jgi:tRNA(Ile)-lysidine synthase